MDLFIHSSKSVHGPSPGKGSPFLPSVALVFFLIFSPAYAAGEGMTAPPLSVPASSVSVPKGPAVGSPSVIHSGLSFGAGWPYAGLKYFFNDDLGAEARFATADNVYVYSLRGYFSFARWENFSFLGGLEGGYVTFSLWNVDNSLRISGTGIECAPLFGTEYFLSRDFSLLLDFSMPVISLNSRDVNIGDVQWVLNGGLYFHPF